jgi:NAD(P)-dependent dehydrogenase (short-subunit alcohol dehydrogenase family)
VNGNGSAGRVAIVAGASGGIGVVTVRALLAAGFRVVAAAPQDALLDALRDELAASAGARAIVVATDITVPGDVERLAARALVDFGRIDALVNLAGIGSTPSLADDTDARMERVVAINLLGAARLIRAVLPAMKAQRRGAIVNIGSVAGEVGVMGIYSGTKFGLRGLTDSVRREVRADGIGVTLVEPGFVRTAMNAGMGDGLPDPAIVADAIVAAIDRPRRRVIVPGWYRAVVFLAHRAPGLFDLVFGNASVQNRLNADARKGHIHG